MYKLINFDKDFNSLLQLSEIFAKKKISDLINFLSNNKSLLTKYNLNKTKLLKSFKILILCDECITKNNLTFDEICTMIDIKYEEVDSFIIWAISEKYIRATINEIDKKVYFSF